MTYLATTRVAVLRGESTDPYGDETADNSAPAVVTALRDMPAELIEVKRNVFDPATGQRRTVRWLRCRLPYAVAHPDTGARVVVELEDDDRIKDNVTGIVYVIDEKVPRRRRLSGQSSLTLDLRDLRSA